MVKKLLLSFVAALGFVTLGFAQSSTISGKVVDVDNAPIYGATVAVEGTQNGVTTGSDGAFKLSVAADDVLVVSYVGYASQSIPVAGKSYVAITLEESSKRIDDVVIVAYGAVSREAKTGSVSALDGELVSIAPSASVEKMLAGKVAGVQITQASGQPGAPTTIKIRGISSITAGNEPLWVVDGIPMNAYDNNQISNNGAGEGTTMNSINPNDIESLTVLKDAAATAVYGSRGANGVILVTTKSGKKGEAKITFRSKIGASTLANDNNYVSMTGEELLNYQRVAIKNAGLDPDDPDGTYYRPMSLLDGGTTDWFDHLTRSGALQEYEVNASGGTDRSSYYSSISYHENQGVYYGVDYERITARLNADYQLTSNLKSGAKIGLTFADQNSPQMGSLYYSNAAYAGLSILPWTKPYNEDGTHNVNIAENSDTNPRANAEYDEYGDKSYRMQGNIFLEWKPIEQITVRTTNAADENFINSRQLWSAYTNKGETTVFEYRTQSERLTTSNTITYDDIVADKHSLRVLLGQEAQYDSYNYLGGYSPSANADIPYPTTSPAEKDQVDYYSSEESLLSFFGIADYSYDSRYYFQGSMRYDGSSLFGYESQWGLFWSLSASWNINNEAFMQDADYLDLLKLRASYGVNGNNNIAPYKAYGLYASGGYNGSVGMLPSSPANPQLAWERNDTFNVGVDFGFFNKITGSIDFYDRVTEDMLLNKRVPQTTGFSSNLINVGSIRNRGVEILVEGNVISTPDFAWDLGANIAFNRTKVLDLADNDFLTATDPRNDGDTPVRIVNGMSMYNFYIRDWYGVNPTNGEGLFWTEDGTLTNDRNQARYIYAGSPEPKFTGGINTSLSYKDFSLSTSLEFVYGNKVLVGNTAVSDGEDMTSNQMAYMLDYWEKPGDTATNPKPVAGAGNIYYASYSSRFLEDGSYLRIKDITLSYNVPKSFVSSIGVGAAKVYVSATNPYTFHDVTGWDPDMGSLGYNSGGVYSMVKSVVGGLEISF